MLGEQPVLLPLGLRHTSISSSAPLVRRAWSSAFRPLLRCSTIISQIMASLAAALAWMRREGDQSTLL